MPDPQDMDPTVAQFAEDLKYTQCHAEVHYLSVDGTPRMLRFHPWTSVLVEVSEDCLKVVERFDKRPGETWSEKTTVIELNKLLIAKLFDCEGCERCDDKGSGALWTFLQGQRSRSTWGYC
ncbi:MAG: hypothetical protein A3I07_03150 [Candidatus Doudnabacteria bacterium RIFCSPLOWO2_02_FULL_42_9]|uniref:Uncharacterized protein n=1 Tax=Candidatus Doudnabacteria bacterium RIFCSPHIGHO2_01_FULL_41_86 TaxID=1817821 RepID=A0A1F5N959_9BACT|nr:MAG: hypothetical protein A2717_01460 [Candidatus Doudnabacteria bacterium RIFCSPHIGHO2_01_FULL_41_86]OGE75057.1 MAG: hypothetical protein A3K07_04790 [Candidatus Doudnabacteria bacterium RIFCSPHIGHO2_01_43_10]OGE85236.1 MAG: hypothetical protein A3E28_01030 [Candidatus Doudnabacteria bacterium RIFCSPHIGHO2_12_FULL_42_22]OGE86774.1 MAG: hypothetical protein A3C49_01865 [Candidatus Doudnabacteria bacterium RIFCSPHIGHO2_02_FULL_42_25]OGE92372.1 MAG: hypothetical protein A2895_02020 [Candidatus